MTEQDLDVSRSFQRREALWNSPSARYPEAGSCAQRGTNQPSSGAGTGGSSGNGAGDGGGGGGGGGGVFWWPCSSLSLRRRSHHLEIRGCLVVSC